MLRWFVLFALGACAASPRAPLAAKTYTIGGEAPATLLVALHYSSATPAMWDELVAGWGEPVRVVFPQGPVTHHRDGFTWFARAHEDKDAAGKLADVEAMTARVAQLIRETRAAHPEIVRVVVTGFSYGGDIAWLLAARYADLVDLAVPMGSRLLGDPTTTATAPVHVLHGELDKIIDARAVAARVDALKARGVPIDITIYPGLGHDLSPALIADWRAKLHTPAAREW
jgi:phospholipase/carboxylesterase